jgi:hypothetical protein
VHVITLERVRGIFCLDHHARACVIGMLVLLSLAMKSLLMLAAALGYAFVQSVVAKDLRLDSAILDRPQKRYQSIAILLMGVASLILYVGVAGGRLMAWLQGLFHRL